ncbi:hypothetical protein K456DRAFT_733860 [Colletotrichum gloeosporioides 23]|nr:hypothetical protein K456DRAFT_733860 [Colletotrichum gloeosporioides 23]
MRISSVLMNFVQLLLIAKAFQDTCDNLADQTLIIFCSIYILWEPNHPIRESSRHCSCFERYLRSVALLSATDSAPANYHIVPKAVVSTRNVSGAGSIFRQDSPDEICLWSGEST